jgi:hypothetical protein
VYQETGVMPDEVSSWVQTVKGTRRLQYSELAKAKGITEATKDLTSNGARAAIRDGTCIHVWTAALDTIADWLRTDPQMAGPTTPSQTPPKTNHSSTETESKPDTWHDEDPADAEETWEWQAPDLSENSL